MGGTAGVAPPPFPSLQRHGGLAGPGDSRPGDVGEETSLTAQFEFDSAEAATQWGDTHFPVLAGAYSRAFGSEAYAMPSIIELKEV